MSKIITTNENLSRPKAHLYVLGCKVNQTEIYSMSSMLESFGFEVDHQSHHPALIFVNTCCVTDSAAGKSRRLIGRLTEKYPDSQIVVTGCLAEINPTMVQQVAPKATILGTYAKDHLMDILSGQNRDFNFLNSMPASSCSEFSPVWRPAPSFRSRAFLKVQDGCSHRCSYCIVPIARGPSRSLELGKAVENARFLVDAGYSEIALTGIHLGEYGRDLSPKKRLEDLVESILAGTSECRLRLSSIEPQEFSEGLLSLIEQNSRICKHFHIPAQSGDDEILKKMFRPYNTKLVAKLTEKILELAPDACIGMDVMVGFPGETDASFERTVSFIESTQCDYLHVFPFSPRQGTVAYGLPDRTPARLSHQRVKILRKLSDELRSIFYSKFIGRTLWALAECAGQTIEEYGKGLTGNYIPVKIKGLAKTHESKIVPVLIDGVKDNEAYGVLTHDAVLTN